MTDRVSTGITYIASGAAVVLGFMNDYAAAFGVLIALATFLTNIWFRWKTLQEIKKNGRDLKQSSIPDD